jgi:hypothetical protein
VLLWYNYIVTPFFIKDEFICKIMSKLIIIYNKEYDTQRVLNTIKKLDWYVENKYNLKNISFPKTLDVTKLKDYSEKEITNAIISEYNENLYRDNELFLNDNWEKASIEIESAYTKSGLLCQEEYRIFLTKYGMGGSYDLPNTVIINLSNSSKLSMLKTIIHEIIHLAIEGDILKYKIGQAQKERIVDLLFVKNFPRRVFIQNVYSSIDTGKIDQIFDDKYPDIKEVIKDISKK